jgi:type I restriction enzyme S subunit
VVITTSAPSGFKESEVGLIPENWDVQPLSRVCDMIIDGTHFTPTYVEQGVPFFSVETVTSGDFANTKFVSRAAHAELSKRCDPRRGDILLTRIGTLGITRFIDWEVEASIYVSLALLRPAKCISGRYLAAYCQSAQFVRDIEARSLLNATPKKINLGDIGRVPVPVPTPGEQDPIADVIFDITASIDTLDTLIAKKRDMKLGAMQQLLRGTTRLPGFSKAWETKRLSDFTGCTAGGTPSTSVPAFWGGEVRWMTSGDLNLKMVREVESRITDEGLQHSAATLLPVNCVLIGLAGQGKTRGTVAMNLVPLATNQSVAAILPNSRFNSRYLYYNLDMRYEEVRGMSTGAAGRGGLNLAIIKSISIPFPDVTEQAAIADVLSDMDAEIDALGRRRQKVNAVKQAMTQALLTGRVRLGPGKAQA